MSHVAVLGASMIPVGEHWSTGLREMAVEVGLNALRDAELDQVDAVYIANSFGAGLNHQSHLGPLIANAMGLHHVEAMTIEAGEASGGSALRAGWLAVKSGAIRTVLVLGVEKVTDLVGSARTKALTSSLDADLESIHGATLPSIAALLMRRYMHEYDVPLQSFEGFTLNAHANGSRNPFAMYRNIIRSGAFARAPMVAEPVTLFDVAPEADGAAAVVLALSDSASVKITASQMATDAPINARDQILHFASVERSTRLALAQAQLTHADIDAFEVHDAFTIFAALTLESSGFARSGRGWEWGDASKIGINGTVPLSTFGGLKARGNPVGATGVYQAVEATMQLMNMADENQVPDARTVMIQNLGGPASTAVTHILQRM